MTGRIEKPATARVEVTVGLLTEITVKQRANIDRRRGLVTASLSRGVSA